jgi:hypothetical protein
VTAITATNFPTELASPIAGTLGAVRALAFTPRWIGGLLFCLTAAAVCAFLGHWQWDVARHGSMQNTAYAFNWWLFAALFVGFWFKALRDTVRRDADLQTGRASGLSSPASRSAAGISVSGLAASPAGKMSRIREPAPQATRPVLPTPEEDPDVAAWNDWLAELNADPKR